MSLYVYIYYYRILKLSNRYMVGITYWCTTEVCFLIILCFLCENILNIRIRTEFLANDIIINYNISDKVRNQATTLKEVVDTWPMTNIVYGMFQLNVNFMLKFINISTTYFILIIQVSHFV
nr:gustatory receptor 32 [Pieris rapae]